MLYLIKDRDYLKIGYSANIDQRKKAYETTNCYAEIIMTKDGTMKDEKVLHELCKQWHYKNEWFYYDNEILRIFEEYKPDNEQRIAELEKEVKDLKSTIEYIFKDLKFVKELTLNHEQTLDQWYSEYKKYEQTCSEILDNTKLKNLKL